jgi:FMN phosphatase YigB (HAD superfamily)
MIPLFDLGNVVVRFSWEPFITWACGLSNNHDRAHAEAFLKSALFIDFEVGAVSREELGRQLAAHFGAEFSQPELERAWCSIFQGLVPGMPEWLAELAGKGPVYCLSNTNEVHLDWIAREMPLALGSFTKVFASHELRMRKPFPEIYREVARQLGTEPSGIVFFDDVQANVDGAREAGLKAYLFSDTSSARDILGGLKGTER